MRRLPGLLAVAMCFTGLQAAWAGPKPSETYAARPKRVLIVVFDQMRPSTPSASA